jgi:predicted aldo/keto reductase-like oxidoreductase
MRLVQRLIESGRIDLLTVHYSMLNRTAWSDPAADSDGGYRRMGRRAAAREIGTVALRVLEGGAMLAEGDAAPARVRSITAVLAGAGIDPAEGAVRFALSNPDVSTVLVGFSNGGQIQSAARCSDLGPLPGSVLHLIEGVS